MTAPVAIRHHTLLQGRRTCSVQATTIKSADATEVFARCAPIASATGRNNCRIQTQVLYDCLDQLLGQTGVAMGDVVIEKALFRSITADFDDFQEVRREAYRKRGITGPALPAITCLQQPPCRPGEDIELQIYAVVPSRAGNSRVRVLSPACEHATVKLVEIGQARHLYITDISGRGHNGKPSASFRQQSDTMFEAAKNVLDSCGLSFPQVLRTWIYLDNIDRDYDELNASRNAFFEQEGVERLPASTGIRGGLHPPGTRCTLDVYALLNPEIADVRIMHTPTLNEAPEYGSSFSRGMQVALPGETCLFISGTASVDEHGATAHVGDIRAQLERMLLNVDELLRAHGATFADLAQATTFLKSAENLGLYEKICAERGVSGIPHSIVEADVCRPDLLCEMEAIAILPAE